MNGRWVTDEYYLDLHGKIEALQKSHARLLAALKSCDVVMDTARGFDVESILPPAYRDSWVAAHIEAIAAIAAAKEVSR